MHGMRTSSHAAPGPWDDIRVFLAVACQGSIARAAKTLDVDAATVSRRLAAFERAMGVNLVTRGRDGVNLTAEGDAIRALAERVEVAILALQSQRTSLASVPGGVVRIATSGILAEGVLARHVERFTAESPSIRLEFLVARRLVELSKGEADIAFRLRPRGRYIAEPSTIAIKLAEVGFALYGTRSAVRAERKIIRYIGLELGADYVGRASKGEPPIVRVDHLTTALALVRAGCGLAVLPCFLADGEPGLVRVSDVLEAHGLYAATLAELRRIPRISAVLRWLKAIATEERARLAGGS